MQPDKVDECLANYKVYSARCEFLRQEIKDLKYLAEKYRNSAIDDAVSLSQTITGMPHSIAINFQVENIAIKFADGYEPQDVADIQNEIRICEKELREKTSTLIFVDAWLKVLNPRERFVIENKTIDGMFWRDLIGAYKQRFNEEYSRQGLKRIRDRAMEKIYDVAG